MRNLMCRVFGHKKTVVWNMTDLTGLYCGRCGCWISENLRDINVPTSSSSDIRIHKVE
jgi:transcription initiation factor TFIIIB Brf1 subunit/transcription initiation factor TFIIB